MHPEVVSDEPDRCPKCGMALELARPAAQKQKVIYTCPMHPQIEQDHPGSCPKCGMALEPKTVAQGSAQPLRKAGVAADRFARRARLRQRDGQRVSRGEAGRRPRRPLV